MRRRSRMVVRRRGSAAYPWEVLCPTCPWDSLIYLRKGVGAVVVNSRGVGNRTHALAMVAAQAHLEDPACEARR